MMITKTLRIIGLFMLMLFAANCSDDCGTCPEPGVAPGVVETYPLESDIDIPTDTVLTVTFDKTMDPASISAGSFTLEGPRGLVNATVSFDGDSTATLTPLERLAGHSIYTARVDPGVRAVDGVQMGVPYAWSFTTGTTPLLIYPDIEFTVRDVDGDGIGDELLGGGPPGRLLQTGENGLLTDRAVIEFPLDEIVHDEVLDAIGLIIISESTTQYDSAYFEFWGFAGDGIANISDWDYGSLIYSRHVEDVDSGMTIMIPMTEFINAALDSSATHIGLRIEATGVQKIGIATSGPLNGDDKAKIILHY
ncbi:MAG: Ig-like domain-containing protein [candidate division Zixibacteria bacterium]